MEDQYEDLEKKISVDPNLNEDEIRILRSIIQTYRGLVGVKVIGSWLVATLATIAGFFVAWDSIVQRFKN